MKYLFFLLTLVASGADAQTTTGRVKWKSASNANYIYTGEIKDGKPNGRGLAVSDPEGDKIVFAEFKDGMIDGRAVISQNTGAISVINYKENKPEGIGLIISPNGDLVYGNLAKDFFGEKATMVYADNTIAFGSVKNGKLNGRVISINSEGNIMEDRFYINDKANGPGYRYELESKELFEGVWENDKWVKDTTGNYPSFMPNPNFGSLVNSDAVIIYSDLIEKDNKKIFQDTCFLYGLKRNIRWFGYYDQSKLRSGVNLIGDSIRIIGQFDDNDKQGLCVEYKKGHYLKLGNYENDKLNGACIVIDIDDSTIYDGYLSAGDYTGNAALLMKNNKIRIGHFIKGNLDGKGQTIYPDGRSMSAFYNEGSLTSINEVLMPNGHPLDHHPKDICTAINFLVKEFNDDFETISGEMEDVPVNGSFKVNYDNFFKCRYSFPGAAFNRILPERPTLSDLMLGENTHTEFTCGLLMTKDYTAVKKQYDNLCQQLSGCILTSLQEGTMLKLVAKVKPIVPNPEGGRLHSFFIVPDYNGNKNNAAVRIMVEKIDDNYQLTLDVTYQLTFNALSK